MQERYRTASRDRSPRTLALGASYYMTVPAPGPVTWFQAYGRQADETCTATWHPSWGQWMNDGTGGWTCDCEQYWSPAGSDWPFRMR